MREFKTFSPKIVLKIFPINWGALKKLGPCGLYVIFSNCVKLLWQNDLTVYIIYNGNLNVPLSTLVLFIFCTLPSDNFLFACNTIRQVHLERHRFIYTENKVNVLSNAGHTWVETLVGNRVQIKTATCS